MQEIEEITQKPDILRFESSNKNLLIQYVLLQDGVIMCYAYGHVDNQSMQDSHEHLVSLLDHLKKGRLNQPFDMIIDFNNIKWIEKSARTYLNRALTKLFELGHLRHIGIISDNYIVRTMGGLWAKLSPMMNYTFYKSEINAYQEILKKRVNSAKQASEASISQDLLNENIIFYRGIKLLLYKKKEWQYGTTTGNVSMTLINSKVLHIAMSGVLTKEMIVHGIASISETYDLLNKEKIALIYEISQLKFPTINIRKYWSEKSKDIENIWEYRFVIANPMMSAFYKIEKFSNPEIEERTELETSVANALDKLLNLPVTAKSIVNDRKTEVDYESYSKKKLIEEIHRLKHTQTQDINQLFEMLSRVSLEKDYKPTANKYPRNEEFLDLFNAVNVIQHDFFSMVQELKEWNHNLEDKVEERTSLLNDKNSELTQLNDELDHFVYCVSHDLRAPLSSIQGLINLMKMEQEEGKSDQYLDLVSKNIKRLDLFIQEILQLSRNARLVIAKETIDFQKIIDNTFSELVYLVESGGIQKNIFIEQETAFINDSHRIVIIFRNLLSNAIKYSVCRHEVPNVSIKVKVDKTKALIEISDNGMGIMKEHIDKVFDMFYRATDTNAGSGLGLYIVKQVVNKLDGEINLSSQVGSGTKVTIVLPNLVE